MSALIRFLARCSVAWAAAVLFVSSPANGAVHALLIGVSDYTESKISNLYGPPNDVALMKDVLTRRFSIPVDNVTALLNPTHSAIEQAFSDLSKRVQRDDHVYIHYSGHGSWAVAPPPGPGETAERRGQDQTWVSHGARSARRKGKDSMDVLDKELGLWMHGLYALTPNVVFVSDSCHSATVTRDSQRGTRSADGTDNVHPLRKSIQRVPEPTTGLRIGAARDFETAVELDPRFNARCSDKKNCYGVFTWHWAAALQASRPGESWGDVFQRAMAGVTATPGVLQRPQMEGVAERAVFDGSFASLSALVPVSELRAGGVVLLGAGLLSGLTVGSELEAAQGNGGTEGRVKVASTAVGTAEARLLSGKVVAGALLREVEHQYANKPLRLFVGELGEGNGALVRHVRDAVEGAREAALQGFVVVNRREEADLRIEVLRPASQNQAVKGARPETLPCSGKPCPPVDAWVLSSLGQLIDVRMRFPMADPAKEIPRLLSNLDKMRHARDVHAVGVQGNGTPMQLQVAILRPPPGSTARCAEGIKADSGWQLLSAVRLRDLDGKSVKSQDCLMFTLDNRDPARTWYGYVLAIDPTYKVEQVWPPSFAAQDEARVEPRTAYAVTKSFYRLDEPGREALIFVVSEGPVPMAGLTQSGLKGGTPRGPARSLARLLSAGALTRGTETELGSWGAETLEFEVPANNRH